MSKKKPSAIKHNVHLKIIKNLQSSLKDFDLDISDVMSSMYQYRNHPLFCQKKADKMEQLKSHLDYDQQQTISNLCTMLTSIISYRKDLKTNSILNNGEFIKQFDVYTKAIYSSNQTAYDWWRKNHQRTQAKVICEKDTKKGIEQDVDKTWGDRNIHVPPLWYHKVWKKGLSGVEYKGRPHFVIDVKPYPIARLEQDNIKMYKADVVTSKGGILTYIEDLWLASFETSPLIIEKKGGSLWDTKPAECIVSLSPELRRAETNVSQRITNGVINNLLD